MSKSITLSLGLTGAKADLPTGKTFGGFRFTATTPTADPTVETTTETTVVISDPIAGATYHCTVAAVDQDGAELEPALSFDIEVPADPVVEQFPSTVGATFLATLG